MEALNIRRFESGRLPDHVVVQRVLDGEKELFEILLRRYNQTLYRAIRSYLRDDEVEDAMQNTYLKAYQRLSQFQGHAAFSTWLVKIGINEALQRLRKMKKSRVMEINSEELSSEKVIRLPDARQMDPEKQAIRREVRLLVEEAIDQLPEKYRVVYVLKEVEGMNNREISACLGLSDSNVKVRLHRAKSLLKELLYKFSSDADIFGFGSSRCDRLTDRVMRQI